MAPMIFVPPMMMPYLVGGAPTAAATALTHPHRGSSAAGVLSCLVLQHWMMIDQVQGLHSGVSAVQSQNVVNLLGLALHAVSIPTVIPAVNRNHRLSCWSQPSNVQDQHQNARVGLSVVVHPEQQLDALAEAAAALPWMAPYVAQVCTRWLMYGQCRCFTAIQGDHPLVGPSAGCIERLSIVSHVRHAGCRGQSSEVQGSATDADPSHRLNKRPDLTRQDETATDGRKMSDAEKRRIRR